jgi:hypothetical protein
LPVIQRADSYVIEIEDEAVGVIVRETDRSVFHAVHPGLTHLDGTAFADATDAVRAVQRLLRPAP